jgi:hypothetical protein
MHESRQIDPTHKLEMPLAAHMEGVPGFLLACVVSILAHPYQGVRHDAILYLGQALHRLWPDILGRDVFFSHGSQDRFTLVTGPLAWLLSHFGVADVEMGLTAACNLAFAAAAWTLCGLIAPGRRWICVVSLALLSHAYGKLALFNYAENFFTGRSLAEPLVLLALVAWATQRHVKGGLLLVLAALIHPLVTIPGVVMAWMLSVARDRRWLWALTALAPIAVLAWAGITPFAGLFERFDDAWWDLISGFDAQVRMTDWNAVDLISAALDLTLLGIAAKVLSPPGRRFVTSALASSMLLLVVAALGGDVIRDVLVVQLQLWRVLWLSHAIAILCLPVIVLDFWREGGPGRLLGAAAVAAELTVSWTLPHAWIFVVWLAVAVVIHWRPADISRTVLRAALAGTVMVVVGVSTLIAVTTYRLIEGDAVLGSVAQPVLVLLTTPALGVLAIVGLVQLLGRLPTWGAVTLMIALLVACTSQWDQRSDWNRTVEATPLGQHPFDRYVPRSAQVYWHTELLPTWAMLGRASYVSIDQGAGIVFNRATAMDFAERSQPMMALARQQVACQVAANAAGVERECQPEQALVEAICRLPRAPDFMVFDALYSRGLIAQWAYRVAHGSAPRTAFLYDCVALR